VATFGLNGGINVSADSVSCEARESFEVPCVEGKDQCRHDLKIQTRVVKMRWFVGGRALIQTVGPRSWGRGERNCGWLGVIIRDWHMEVGSPSVVHDLDMPQHILGVTPPLEDDRAIKRDFAAGAMENHFAPNVDQGGNGEEIVHEVR
jgi:hypothetical protein